MLNQRHVNQEQESLMNQGLRIPKESNLAKLIKRRKMSQPDLKVVCYPQLKTKESIPHQQTMGTQTVGEEFDIASLRNSIINPPTQVYDYNFVSTRNGGSSSYQTSREIPGKTYRGDPDIYRNVFLPFIQDQPPVQKQMEKNGWDNVINFQTESSATSNGEIDKQKKKMDYINKLFLKKMTANNRHSPIKTSRLQRAGSNLYIPPVKEIKQPEPALVQSRGIQELRMVHYKRRSSVMRKANSNGMISDSQAAQSRFQPSLLPTAQVLDMQSSNYQSVNQSALNSMHKSLFPNVFPNQSRNYFGSHHSRKTSQTGKISEGSQDTNELSGLMVVSRSLQKFIDQKQPIPINSMYKTRRHNRSQSKQILRYKVEFCNGNNIFIVFLFQSRQLFNIVMPHQGEGMIPAYPQGLKVPASTGLDSVFQESFIQ